MAPSPCPSPASSASSPRHQEPRGAQLRGGRAGLLGVREPGPCGLLHGGADPGGGAGSLGRDRVSHGAPCWTRGAPHPDTGATGGDRAQGRRGASEQVRGCGPQAPSVQVAWFPWEAAGTPSPEVNGEQARGEASGLPSRPEGLPLAHAASRRARRPQGLCWARGRDDNVPALTGGRGVGGAGKTDRTETTDRGMTCSLRGPSAVGRGW